MSLYKTLRPLIFMNDPELAHKVTINLLRLAGGNALTRWFLRILFPIPKNTPQVNAFGLTFSNSLGMAAGYDKEGTAWRGLACLGFGHIEVGTVTPRPQPGNPKPRIIRLAEDEAVINRMGFPGKGAEVMLRHMQTSKPKGLILGVNIGKNKDTAIEESVEDYRFLVDKFAEVADYLAVNVSSPNTPGLRTLQQRNHLESLLMPLVMRRDEHAARLQKQIPLLVKLAPDLEDAELDQSLEAIRTAGIDGVIIGNTTLSRNGLTSARSTEQGGLSGRPLNDLNTQMIVRVNDLTAGKIPIIASGGVMSSSDAQRKLDAGAVLVQLYTGLIYEGPGLPSAILRSGVG